jgi:hypothetical protein
MILCACATVELKNPLDEAATIRRAFNQLQIYERDMQPCFLDSEVLVV